MFKLATALTQAESALGSVFDTKLLIFSEQTFESGVRHLMAELPISIKILDWDIKKM